MHRNVIGQLPSLIVPDGGSTSNTIQLRATLALGIVPPDSMDGTVDVQVSVDGERFADHPVHTGLSGGEAIVLDPFPFRFIRVVTSESQTAERVFHVSELG